MTELTAYFNFARGIADKAGKMLLKFHSEALEQKYTSRTHFRTVADETIDTMAVMAIRKQFPDHGILSEESGTEAIQSPWKWVIDSVDGTINLWSGLYDHFAFCISLNYEGKPVLGIVNAALRNEYYSAIEGEGAFCNNKPIHVANITDIAHVIMDIDSGKERRDAHIPFLTKAYGPRGVTYAGISACASVPLALVGSGVLNAYLATSLAPEDMAASVIIIREAGGKVTNLQGKEWTLTDSGILAANHELHKELGKFFEIF